MRVLIDTCVIIDALANRQPWNEDAKDILRFSLSRKIDGCVSAKSIIDIHYIIKKYNHDESLTRKSLSILLQAVSSVDTKGLECSVGLTSPTLDYEDAVQVETALDNGCDYIVTRNIKDYSFSSVKAIEPKDALKLIISK